MFHDASSRIATTGKIAAFGAAATLIINAVLIPAAYAVPGNDMPSVVVRYDARQAATDQGALELYARLVYAAQKVCPSEIKSNMSRTALVNQCQKDAVARAVSQIHERHLVAIAASRANRG
jgi:UrcA family protein